MSSAFVKQKLLFQKIQRTLKRLEGVTAALLLAFIVGCTPMIRQAPHTLSGTFACNLSDGKPLTITFSQEENTISGHGVIGERPFSLSALASWYGPMVIVFEEGHVLPARVALSPDGENATISGMGPPVILKRGGGAVRAPSGPFAGFYATDGFPRLWLDLTQGGDLLSGTGFLHGKPVAVVGKVTEPKKAEGTILFSDESRARVKALISDDGQTMIVEGIGAPVKLRRKAP